MRDRRFFAEPALSGNRRFFAALRMTKGEGLRMTRCGVAALGVTKGEGLRVTERREAAPESSLTLCCLGLECLGGWIGWPHS